MHILQYPYLSELLGGYFHQDVFDDGENDDDIIRDFIASSHPYQRLGVRADVQRFLHHHRGELAKAMDRAFSPDVILGANDEELEAWLVKLDTMLKE